MRLSTLAEKVRVDTTSGASEILISVLRDLNHLTRNVDGLGRDEVREFAFSLHRSKPSMAPIFNLSNSILCLIEDHPQEIIPSSLLRSLFTTILRREEAANASIAAVANRLIGASRIVTISYSSTVVVAIKAMGENRKLSVVVAESEPGGEGKKTADIIASSGIETELIPDSMVASRSRDADAAIVGADAVTPEGVVNKVGTYALALAAGNHDIPVHVLCSQSKISPMAFANVHMTGKRLGENLIRMEQIFESTPLDLFSRILTDSGVIRPADLRSKLKDYRKALAWQVSPLSAK